VSLFEKARDALSNRYEPQCSTIRITVDLAIALVTASASFEAILKWPGRFNSHPQKSRAFFPPFVLICLRMYLYRFTRSSFGLVIFNCLSYHFLLFLDGLLCIVALQEKPLKILPRKEDRITFLASTAVQHPEMFDIGS